jgi:competence protein ComGC
MKQVDNPTLKGMGTTVVALLINEYSALVAHAGDSRLYQYRRGSTIFRTSDHSMVAELVRAGTLSEEQARLSAQSNVINRALGHGDYCEVDIEELPYEAKDRFLLCTDGVWGIMPEKQLVRLTAQTASLSGVIESTVIQVNENGRNTGNHHDNLTLVILETRRNSKLKQKMSTRVRNLLLALVILCCISVLGNVFMYNMWKSNPDLQTAQPHEVEKLIETKLEEQKREYEDRMQKLQNQLEALTDEKQELEELLKNKGAKAEAEEVSSKERESSVLIEKLDQIIHLEALKKMLDQT